MKSKFINMWLELAEIASKYSNAKRLQVGAIIVKNNCPISIGINGTPEGWDNNCEIDLNTKPEVIHAECNAVAKLAKSTQTAEGAIMFCTHSPCFECAKIMYISGISKVYYKTLYRTSEGIEFLKKCNIEVIKID